MHQNDKNKPVVMNFQISFIASFPFFLFLLWRTKCCDNVARRNASTNHQISVAALNLIP